ncbi:MAG: malto-oligosyltrehalose trehalohydrolase [Candidatus Omnitrophota bacterium]
MKIGASYLGDGKCSFTVWAPRRREVALDIIEPIPRRVVMKKDHLGYWKVVVDNVAPGSRYFFVLDGVDRRPDPASYFQPQGVHGPSEVVNHAAFLWSDAGWRGNSLQKMIIYELHVGAFTPEGSFESVIGRLDDLVDLGVNTIEVMPIAQFPGERNWGYDGTYLYAAQNSYGGPVGFKRLVDACHQKGLSIILDVVYNHLGPEGNYLRDFGPYFTDRYKTPWGSAIDFEGFYRDGVRDFFVQNMLSWFENYHVDGLRLDAIHGIYDASPKHILQELSEEALAFSEKQARSFYLIAESDLNESKVIRIRELGGYGLDAQWCDDFHHILHVLLTGEQDGYYVDFHSLQDFKKSMTQGYIYSGQHSQYRGQPHGDLTSGLPAYQFVVCSQNHDQVGNRMGGERLSELVCFQRQKLAAAIVLTSPYIPLLFMGQEYGEDAPFLYFISHSDQGLIKATSEGRKKEFASFITHKTFHEPHLPETFMASKLHWEKRGRGEHKTLLEFYKVLIRLRKELPSLNWLDNEHLHVTVIEDKNIAYWYRWHRDSRIFCIANFHKEKVEFLPEIEPGRWKRLLDSADLQWMGPGSLLPEELEQKTELMMQPFSFVLYERKN